MHQMPESVESATILSVEPRQMAAKINCLYSPPTESLQANALPSEINVQAIILCILELIKKG